MKNEKKCPHCNATIENNIFCKLCGLDIDNPSNSKNHIVNGPNTFKKYSNVLLIILIILAVISIALSFTNVPEKIKDIAGFIPVILLACIITCIGFMALQIGLKMKNLYINGRKATGKIVDYKEMKNTLATTQIPIIEFEANKTKYRTVSNLGINQNCKISDDVEIMYNSNNPYESMALGNLLKYKTMILLGFLCFIFAILFVLFDILF